MVNSLTASSCLVVVTIMDSKAGVSNFTKALVVTRNHK
jgi:hypothetical protein